ncbi:MAG: hypothetical protein LBQ65_09735, partial [Tannerellaceae bacterium]|nr:hypothetical protein [Tannerellaceae bacterium]
SATGKQNVYTSEPRSSKPKTTSGQTIEFLGVSCNIVEYLNAAIRLQTPRKFTKAEIEKGMKSFPYKNKIVYFTRVKDRSNDYASVINGEIFYF